MRGKGRGGGRWGEKGGEGGQSEVTRALTNSCWAEGVPWRARVPPGRSSG